jgi:hypothetical protein
LGDRKQGTPKPAQPQSMVADVQRVRRWKRIVKNTLIVCCLIGFVGAACWGLAQLVFRSSIFQVTDIKVNGSRVSTQRQILDLAGIQQGGSLFRFDVRAAEARIATHPWVERAAITTQWPSSIEIEVIEFQPFALMQVEDGTEKNLRYINRAGRLFAEAGQGQELDFPVITGVRLDKDLAADRLVKGSMAESAWNLLVMTAKGNAILPVQAVSEVHVDQQAGIILYLVDRPFPIYFGSDRLQMKYSRLLKVLEQLYTKKKIDAVKDIRMDYSDDKVLVTGVQIDE